MGQLGLLEQRAHSMVSTVNLCKQRFATACAARVLQKESTPSTLVVPMLLAKNRN